MINPQHGAIVEIKEAHKHVQEAARLTVIANPDRRHIRQMHRHIEEADKLLEMGLGTIHKEWRDKE